MSTVDTLVTKYVLDNQQYKQASNEVEQSTAKMQGVFNIASKIVTAYAAGITAAAGALVLLAKTSFEKYAEFDALRKALEAVTGSAEKAKKALMELKDVAKLPGLGYQEAIQGYTQLLRFGLDDQTSMRLIRSAGNANALGGGGRQEMERIFLAFSQILTQPNVRGQELMQLAQSGIPSYQILKDQFGTSDTMELQKLGVTSREAVESLIKGMEKMPKAADSAKNELENLQMGIEQAFVGIGAGLNDAISGTLGNLTEVLGKLDENGFFKSFGENMGSLALSYFPELGTSGDDLENVFRQLAATVLDVEQALGNLKMNIQSIGELLGKVGEASMWANPLTLPFMISEKFLFPGQTEKAMKEMFGAGDGVLSAGENYLNQRKRDDQLAEARRRQSEKKAEAERVKKDDEQKNALPDPNIILQTKHLANIDRNIEELNNSMKEFTLGGSFRGKKAFNSVNINNLTHPHGDPMTSAINYLRMAFLQELASNNATIGI